MTPAEALVHLTEPQRGEAEALCEVEREDAGADHWVETELASTAILAYYSWGAAATNASPSAPEIAWPEIVAIQLTDCWSRPLGDRIPASLLTHQQTRRLEEAIAADHARRIANDDWDEDWDEDWFDTAAGVMGVAR